MTIVNRLIETPIALLTLFVIVICIVFSILTSSFLTESNAIIIVSGSAVLAMIALGQTFTLISGGFDLSVSGVAPLAAVVFCLLSNAHVPTIAAILTVLLIGAAVGVLNGTIITRVGINPLITTLGMLSITGGAAYAVSSGVTVALADPTAGFLANTLPGRLPVFVLVLLLLAVAGGLVLKWTTVGRSIFAVGGNRDAAWLSGLRTDRITIYVYVISGALAALAGVVVASQLLAGSGTIESDAALNSIAAAVLGGAALAGGEGSVVGTMLGVLVIGLIGNGLQLLHISSFYQQIATGVILLLAVASQQLRRLTRKREQFELTELAGDTEGAVGERTASS